MVEHQASVDFDNCIESALTGVQDKRIRIILQIMAASISADSIEQFKQELDKLPDLQRRNEMQFSSIVGYFRSAALQLVAMDIDRASPLRILGTGRATATVLFGAKALGHDVTLVARPNFVITRLLKLYQMLRVDQTTPDALPDGPFDLIISFGSTGLGTKKGWVEFLQPLDRRLTGDGRVFIALASAANRKSSYYPQVVMSNLTRMGARVSRKASFVLLDKAVIGRFQHPISVEEAAGFDHQEPNLAEADTGAPLTEADKPYAPSPNEPSFMLVEDTERRAPGSEWPAISSTSLRERVWLLVCGLVGLGFVAWIWLAR